MPAVIPLAAATLGALASGATAFGLGATAFTVLGATITVGTAAGRPTLPPGNEGLGTIPPEVTYAFGPSAAGTTDRTAGAPRVAALMRAHDAQDAEAAARLIEEINASMAATVEDAERNQPATARHYAVVEGDCLGDLAPEGAVIFQDYGPIRRGDLVSFAVRDCPLIFTKVYVGMGHAPRNAFRPGAGRVAEFAALNPTGRMLVADADLCLLIRSTHVRHGGRTRTLDPDDTTRRYLWPTPPDRAERQPVGVDAMAAYVASLPD